MKIFDWIHPHRSVPSSSFSFNGGRKTRLCVGKIDDDEERKPLLAEIGMMDVQVFENWKMDGILTIGTLAIDPLESGLSQKQDINHGATEKQANEEIDGDEKQTLKSHFPVVGNPDCDINMCNMHPQASRDVITCNSMELADAIPDNVEKEENLMVKMMEKKGRRVTLLDLFLADDSVQGNDDVAANYSKADDDPKAHSKKKTNHKNPPVMLSEKPTTHSGKKGLSSKAKKLLPRVSKEDLHLLKKLNRFMTRMTEKKIHPDLDQVQLEKKGSQSQKYHSMKPSNDVVSVLGIHAPTYGQAVASSESVSLLPVPDIMV